LLAATKEADYVVSLYERYQKGVDATHRQVLVDLSLAVVA